MNALNAKYKTQPMKWDSITFPLLQGTPVNADGEISNDGDAIGMVTETFTEKPLLPALSILIAGDIDESEIVYELSDEAAAAMSGIRIYKADGSRESSGGGGGTIYRHRIRMDGTEAMHGCHLMLTILSSSNSTPITGYSSLTALLDSGTLVSLRGYLEDTEIDSYMYPYDMYMDGETGETLKCYGIIYNNGEYQVLEENFETFVSIEILEDGSIEFTDTVTEV